MSRRNTIEDVTGKLVLYDGDCLLWTGRLSDKGYGTVKFHGRRWYVHKLLWEHFVGPVEQGLELDHLCRVRNCANVEHLEPVPHKVNCQRGEGGHKGGEVQRAKAAARTHCSHGHMLVPENIYLEPRTGRRHCHACCLRRAAEQQDRKRIREGRVKGPRFLPPRDHGETCADTLQARSPSFG